MLSRMRSGQSKLLAAFRAKVQGEDPVCPKCNGSEETLVHFMQECPATEASRRRIFETFPLPLCFVDAPEGVAPVLRGVFAAPWSTGPLVGLTAPTTTTKTLAHVQEGQGSHS